MTLNEWLVSGSTVMLKIGARRLNQILNKLDDFNSEIRKLTKEVETLKRINSIIKNEKDSLKNDLQLNKDLSKKAIEDIIQENIVEISELKRERELQDKVLDVLLKKLSKSELENKSLMEEIQEMNNLIINVKRF